VNQSTFTTAGPSLATLSPPSPWPPLRRPPSRRASARRRDFIAPADAGALGGRVKPGHGDVDCQECSCFVQISLLPSPDEPSCIRRVPAARDPRGDGACAAERHRPQAGGSRKIRKRPPEGGEGGGGLVRSDEQLYCRKPARRRPEGQSQRLQAWPPFGCGGRAFDIASPDCAENPDMRGDGKRRSEAGRSPQPALCRAQGARAVGCGVARGVSDAGDCS
jgi:hypothetical protein